MPTLISVHFPKAAGSSLARAYAAAFGDDRVCQDYENDPVDPCARMYLDPARYEALKPTSLGRHAVVHGHFHVNRYARVRDAVRTVVLREPVENLISIYYYFDALRRGLAPGHGLYQYFCHAGLGLLGFAAMPAIRRMMSERYFRDVDMGCFDVIGDFADLDGFLERVGELMMVELGPLPRLNVTPHSDERYEVSQDPHMLAALRDLLADDLRFYERYCSQ